MVGDRGDGPAGYGGGGNRDGDDRQRLADDPRAVAAADEWRRRLGREGHEGSYDQHGGRAYDEAYQRYRQRHIEELDRDYAEWCREREQQFQRDYHSWRQQRGAPVPQSGGEIDSD